MMKYGIMALALAAIAAGGWAFIQDKRATRLERDNEALEQSLATARAVASMERQARAIADAERRAAERRAAEQAAAIEELLTGDFTNADVAIDPRISDLLDCLRRQDEDCSGQAGSARRASDALPDQ